MEPVIRVVTTPDCEWGVIYFVSDISDKKVWEGHEYSSNAIPAMATLWGAETEYYEFTDEEEVSGCTPDTFKDIKGIKKFATSS
jgi:hypothetical protein